MARTRVFSPVNLSLTHSESFYFLFFLSLLPKLHLLGLFYNPTNPIFQHFSLTSAAAVLPFPSLVILFLPISIFLSCLCFSLFPSHRRFSLSLYHVVSVRFFAILFFFIFFVFATLLGAWCLGGEKTWESKNPKFVINLNSGAYK